MILKIFVIPIPFCNGFQTIEVQVIRTDKSIHFTLLLLTESRKTDFESILVLLQLFFLILGSAEGEFVHDSADVQRASLMVIINCVCAPINRPNSLGRSTTGITGSSVKKKPTGKSK